MAPRDPLVNALKACLLNLQPLEAVTDSNPHLSNCCQLLELIFRKGLQQPVLSLVRRDYWQCFERLLRQDTCGRSHGLARAVEEAKSCKKTLSAQGRGRQLIRLALVRGALPAFVAHLLHTPSVLEWYSPAVSIFRKQEFSEPFMSLLLVLSHVEFKLDLQNCSFLDESWLLPVCETYQVVPCRQTGMLLSYLGGRVFLRDTVAGGQADADGFVRHGDVIDEIDGICLRNPKNGQADMILSRLKGCPLSIRLVRCRAPDGTVYAPLVKTLRALKTENLDLGPAPSRQPPSTRLPPTQLLKEGRQVDAWDITHHSNTSTIASLLDRIVYIVQFLGAKKMAVLGTKERLQSAISHVLQQNQPSKEVLLDLQETHLTCTERNSKVLLCEHHYPDVSCVGRYAQPDGTMLGFCVINRSPETKTFSCVVLKAATSQECQAIVCHVATGFKHTEWFV
ncbi:uncharacterized protein LOC144211211 isoform X2 [Stigmatopora nigra]